MKKNIVFALLASAIFLAGLTGCVSQKEHEGVVAQVQALESENTRVKAEALELSAKVDEYENGKENLLVKVRNHFEKKEYDEAKQLAQTLHKKFNGTSEDQQAQQIIQQIDKTLEEQKRTKEAAESKAAAEKKKMRGIKQGRLSGFLKFIRGRPIQRGVSIYISYGRTCPTKRSNMLILRRFPLTLWAMWFPVKSAGHPLFMGRKPALIKKARGILAHISGKTHGIILPLLPHRYEVLRLHIWTALP